MKDNFDTLINAFKDKTMGNLKKENILSLLSPTILKKCEKYKVNQNKNEFYVCLL